MFCRLCSNYLDRHPEVLSPANQGGAGLARLLDVVESGGHEEYEHTTLPGRELHARALLASGGVMPPKPVTSLRK